MTDPADHHLEQRLHALAQGVHPPMVPVGDDVRRGRRRLVKVRVAMGGGVTAALVVVLGITGLTAGSPTATTIEPAIQPSTALPASPAPSQSPSESADAAETGEPDAESDGSGAAADGAGGSSGSGSADTGTDTGLTPGRLPGQHDGSHPSRPTESPTEQATEQPSGQSTEEPTGQTTEQPSGQPTGPPTGLPTTTPPVVPPTTPPTTTPPTTPPTIPTPPTGGAVVRATLKAYNDVLAEHLDPDRDHLATYDRRNGPRRTTYDGGLLFALGSTYRWSEGRGTAGLAVDVASGWDQAAWQCGTTGTDWTCSDGGLSGVRSEVATHDGLRAVAVEHSDGQVVVLTADPTYDDDARGVLGFGSDVDELLDAAADAELALPGNAPEAPPVIDLDDFTEAGESDLVLASADETFTETGANRSPQVRGDWFVDGGFRGTLAWSAQPVYSGAAWQCLDTYRVCTTVTTASGQTVQVAAVKKKAGGGWVFGYDGPSYAVRVTTSDPTFARKRAYAFVTDAAWQPTR